MSFHSYYSKKIPGEITNEKGNCLLPPGDTRLALVRVLVSPTDTKHIKSNFLNGIEGFFTGRPSNRIFECMWTHFAMELVFDGGTVLKLERNVAGIYLAERDVCHSEYETWTGKPDEPTTLDHVMRFFDQENQRVYSAVDNNCKHFAYNFFANIFHRRPIGDFGKWCRAFEDVYRQKTNH